MKFNAIADVTQLDQFDEKIDVRSPAEFALDHIVGAINLPVLDDIERAQVGTRYKQTSSFEAKKVGAALVARNIARHLETTLADRPKNWQPLIYCWRGGNRSASLAHVLRQIGWNAQALDGGYKAYRRFVIDELNRLPSTLQLRIICGPTGSGKSRLLQQIAKRGGQVLDLEELAAHRGSVLGNLPDRSQPSQKHFESTLWDAMRRFSTYRSVFVEAESVKIGRLRVPETLIARMWDSPCLSLSLPMGARVEFLTQEYAHFLQDLPDLAAKLRGLHSLYGREKIERWLSLASGRRWQELVEQLLEDHYDPAYRRSTLSHYPTLNRAPTFRADRIDAASLEVLATEILQSTENEKRIDAVAA